MRFPEAVKHVPAIDRWFNERPADLAAIAKPWFAHMRQCGENVRELLHDGHPTACVGDAAFAYVNVFRDHVNVGFFVGARLDDPAGLLEGSGKRMRHVKLFPGRPVNSAAILRLIDVAYKDMQMRASEEVAQNI